MQPAPSPAIRRRAFAPLLTLRDIQALTAVYTGSVDHLFIHIPKNAGVSLRKNRDLRWKMVGVHRQFLRDRAYVRELLTTMGAAGQHHGIAHARLRDLKPWLAQRLQPVAIVRNPWARTVSRYRFALLAAEQGSPFSVAGTDSFEAFLETRHEDGTRPFFWHRAVRGWYPQRDYVVDDSDHIAADILRQEHLGTDASAYFNLTQPPRPRNVTSSKAPEDWRSLYTSETVQAVAEWYAGDIEAFGFDFDTPATRNIWTPPLATDQRSPEND